MQALKIGGRDQRVFAWRMLEVRGRRQRVHIDWMVGIGGREDSAANISAANPLASDVHESLRNLADKLAESAYSSCDLTLATATVHAAFLTHLP